MRLSPAQVDQRRNNVVSIATQRRAATHCKRGHAFTPVNTYTRPGNRRRMCLTCKTDRRWYSYRGFRMAA